MEPLRAPDEPTDPNLLLQGHEDARNQRRALARTHPTVTGRNEGSRFSTANGKTIQAQIPSPRISKGFFLLFLVLNTCYICLTERAQFVWFRSSAANVLTLTPVPAFQETSQRKDSIFIRV